MVGRQNPKKGEQSEPETTEPGAATPFKEFTEKPKNENDWWEMFKTIGTALVGVKTELEQLRSLKGTVNQLSSNFTDEWKKNVDDKIQVLDLCDSEKDFRINLITKMVTRQQHQIEDLQNKVTAAHNHEVRCNVIIHGIIEERNETYSELVDKVNDFIKTKLEIEEEIVFLDTYRLGKSGTRDRPVCLKLQRLSDKSKLFSNASSLKGKTNTKKRLFLIRDDQNDHQTEVREYFKDLINENKDMEDGKKKTIRLNKGKVIVNNVPVVKKIEVPKPATTLKLSNSQIEVALAVQLVQGDTHIEKGSEFLSFAQWVKTLDDIQDGLQKLKIKYADATHVPCGYRLRNPMLNKDQGYEDDGEIGQGRNILNALKAKAMVEICVYVVRYYGYAHLGPRRFDIAKDLTFSAVRAFKVARQSNIRRLKQIQCSESCQSLQDDDNMSGIYPASTSPMVTPDQSPTRKPLSQERQGNHVNSWTLSWSTNP